MHARQRGWAATPYPYGSEFGFDTTGQEEVVVWNLYFGNTSAAKQTVDHVLSYMRSSGTWAYNGGSRSWGDIGNNGKYLATFGTGAQDRGLMHYRSGLNMIPLIEWYRQHPDDHFALEVAMGALTGQMANIDKDGAPSMMFHAVSPPLTPCTRAAVHAPHPSPPVGAARARVRPALRRLWPRLLRQRARGRRVLRQAREPRCARETRTSPEACAK